MENSLIKWCDNTFNPWIGCSKVSPACDNCYAEVQQDKRYHRVKWGPHGERSHTAPSTWKEPRKWHKEALAEGKRPRVFCASLADVFDNHKSILPSWRSDLWDLIPRVCFQLPCLPVYAD